MDLGWSDNYNPCREEVYNTPESIRNHMVDGHGWSEIPDLPLRDILAKRPHPKTKEIMTKKQYMQFINNDAKEWFWDNQLYWIGFRNSHFPRKIKGAKSQ